MPLMQEETFDRGQEEEAILLEVALEQMYQCFQDDLNNKKGTHHKEESDKSTNKKRKSRRQMNKRRGKVSSPGVPHIPDLPAMVARTVSKEEAKSNPKCIEALDVEWGKLAKAKVWLNHEAEEWSKVRRKADKDEKEIHVGSLHELIVEKGSELKEGDINRK